MNVTVNPKYKALLPKLPEDEYKALKQSIQTEGQHFPITINSKGVILDGHHRWQICKELGFDLIVETKQFDNELLEDKFVIEANLQRRHLNKFQKAELGMPLLEIEKELAKQRQKLHYRRVESIGSTQSKATTQVAKKIGLSEKTFERAKKIIEEAPESIKAKVRSDEQSISYAYQQVMREEKHTFPPELPEGKFDVIYADPPWAYDYTSVSGNVEVYYHSMKTSEICALPIPSAEEAMLFLWATNPKLPDALRVMGAWGFKYKTNMSWVKGKGGIGHYLQGDHELLLIGKKGNIPPPMPSNRPSSVLQKSKTKHSVKPVEVYEIIEKMYPNRKYLELFSRNKREGWTMWGDEAE